MIRPTIPEETTLLVNLTEATGLFKPLEVEALTEVFADYFAGNRDFDHRSITAEHNGVVMGFVYNGETGTSDLMLLDSVTLDTVAEVHLPARVPHGFHGNWVPN